MTNEKTTRAGKLFVVGTPIGNVGDLSERAREVLGRVDIVAAEDTRRTRRLLSRISVQTPAIAYHDHNESEAARALLARLLAGESVALVSDAGTPLVSDPGFRLVARAIEAGVEIAAVPGPSALTAALSISGLPTDRFVFEGFLPRRIRARAGRLAELAREPRTLVFFESVHRLAPLIAAMIEAFGRERRAVIHRELTKLHEASYAGTLESLEDDLAGRIPMLGEFVIVVEGAATPPAPGDAELRRVFRLLADAVGDKAAVALTAAVTGASRNSVYRATRS